MHEWFETKGSKANNAPDSSNWGGGMGDGPPIPEVVHDEERWENDESWDVRERGLAAFYRRESGLWVLNPWVDEVAKRESKLRPNPLSRNGQWFYVEGVREMISQYRRMNANFQIYSFKKGIWEDKRESWHMSRYKCFEPCLKIVRR